MRHSLHRLASFLVFAGLFLVCSTLAFSGTADVDQFEPTMRVTLCAERLEKMFSVITVQTRELDLEHAKLVVVGETQVVIPLKKPHDHVKAIRWLQRDLADALDLIRLLQQGKIGAVNLLPFRHDPAAMYQMRAGLWDELQGCQNREKVLEVLGQCSECLVREWVDIKP